jgi:hypothetical protein
MRAQFGRFVKRKQTQEVKLRRTLRRQVLRCVMQAVAKLAREAGGEQTIDRESELRACVALARLAPVLLGANAQRQVNDDDNAWQGPRIHPDCPIEEAERIIAEAEERARVREEQARLALASSGDSTSPDSATHGSN